MSMTNPINVYRCPKKHHTVTIDRDNGTTPFMLRCREPGCTEMAQSSFCRVSQSLAPTHEWVRPTTEQVKEYAAALMLRLLARGVDDLTLDDVVRETNEQHVDNGGLLLRRIDNGAWD